MTVLLVGLVKAERAFELPQPGRRPWGRAPSWLAAVEQVQGSALSRPGIVVVGRVQTRFPVEEMVSVFLPCFKYG